jgi:hypothetical protein
MKKQKEKEKGKRKKNSYYTNFKEYLLKYSLPLPWGRY